MTLYTRDGAYPREIPFRIHLSDGRSRTDPKTFSDEEIADAGFVAAPEKPETERDQRVDWTGEDWRVVTLLPKPDTPGLTVAERDDEPTKTADGEWQLGWTMREMTEAERTVDLDKPEFEYALAYRGLDEVFDDVQEWARQNDRTLYADMRSQRSQDRFELGATLEMVARMRNIAGQVAPLADLSDDGVREVWAEAAATRF